MTSHAHSSSIWLKGVLLANATMTIMAGATISPALPTIQKAFHATPNIDILVRLFLTLPALMIAAGSPVVGMIIDRWGRKRYLVLSILLYGIAGSSGLYLKDLYSLLLGRALLGIAVAGTMTCGITLVGDYFQGSDRIRFLGMQSAGMAAGGVIFLTGGGILAEIGWRMPFLIYLSSFMILPGVLLIVYEPHTIRTKMHAIGHNACAPLPRLTILGIYALSFFNMTLFYMIPMNLPFFLTEMIDASTTRIGIAIACSTLVGACLSTQYQRCRMHCSSNRIFALVFFLMGAGYMILLFSSTYTHVIAAMLVHGAGMGLAMPNINAWLLETAPDALRGRIVGGMSTAMYLGMFCSPILTQPLIRYTGLAGAYGIAGLLLLLMMIVFMVKAFRHS